MILGWVVDAKMGGLEKQEQAFRIIRVAKYFLGVVKYSENRSKGGPKDDQHRLLWNHRVGFLRCRSVLEKENYDEL